MRNDTKIYRLFLGDEDPSKLNDGEKVVIRKAKPTLRDVRSLVQIIGEDALEYGIASNVCLLAKGVAVCADRAVASREKFPVVIIHGSDIITLARPNEAIAFTNKWKANASILAAVKNLSKRKISV